MGCQARQPNAPLGILIPAGGVDAVDRVDEVDKVDGVDGVDEVNRMDRVEKNYLVHSVHFVHCVHLVPWGARSEVGLLRVTASLPKKYYFYAT